jgi:hypothetical protein
MHATIIMKPTQPTAEMFARRSVRPGFSGGKRTEDKYRGRQYFIQDDDLRRPAKYHNAAIHKMHGLIPVFVEDVS